MGRKMASAGLPSFVLWQGMKSRASGLPMLMQDAISDDSLLASERVNASLRQLAALANIVQATQFALYCRECIKLLALYVQQRNRRTTLEPLLLGAAVRVLLSLASPLQCFIDSGNLNELRRARGASVVDHINRSKNPMWAEPSLKSLLRKQLLSAHYALGDSANYSEPCDAPAQSNSFRSLNRVAALCLGRTLLENVENARSNQQTCVQILRLELCCHPVRVSEPPKTLKDMRKLHLETATAHLLRALRRKMRELIVQAEQREGVNLELSLWILQRANVCCALLKPSHAQAIVKICVSAQHLALHLRCWASKECEAHTLLYLCALALERHLDIAIAVQQGQRPCERTDIRLCRKVQHFLRTHRRRLRSVYSAPFSNVRVIACKEVQGIHQQLRESSKLHKKTRTTMSVDDELFYSVIRCKAIALYMGEMALYELLFSIRELVVLAIERRLMLTKIVFSLLPRLTAYCLRSLQKGGRVLGYDTRLISSLSESLRAYRQVALSKITNRDSRISLPVALGQGKNRDKRTIATTQLPSFLAKNIRYVIADPVAFCGCQSTQEFAKLSREVVLELTVLARGARALQVDRVAALSEVLLETYRSLNALAVLPAEKDLQENLQGAHRCLRLALNQAAARQAVCEVRPTIVSLYRFVEFLHRAPAHAPDSIQAALSAVNSLAADMRVFADVFTSAIAHGRAARIHLAQDQLRALLAATSRLQEDLCSNGMIAVARWGPAFNYTVGRYSNERGKPARLALLIDGIEAPRTLVQGLQSPLQTLLCLMIEHSVELVTQRRAAGKPDSAQLRVLATRSGTQLRLCLQDDGSGLTGSELNSVSQELEALGGSLSLEGKEGGGSMISVLVDCASVRWDIASKPL